MRRKPVSEQTKKQALHDYQHSTKTVDEISAEYGISRGTIYYHLGKQRSHVTKGGGGIRVSLLGNDSSDATTSDSKQAYLEHRKNLGKKI